MHRSKNLAWLRAAIGLLALLLLSSGCITADVNPSFPAPTAGYVDFYVENVNDLNWLIQQEVPGETKPKKLYGELKPPSGGFVRLLFEPGNYKLHIAILNRTVADPVTVDVKVVAEKITPVMCVLTPAGTAKVQNVDDSRSATFYGSRGRRSKYSLDENQSYRLTAAVLSPLPYATKGHMSYAPGKEN